MEVTTTNLSRILFPRKRSRDGPRLRASRSGKSGSRRKIESKGRPEAQQVLNATLEMLK
jgi:hypothetical protein